MSLRAKPAVIALGALLLAAAGFVVFELHGKNTLTVVNQSGLAVRAVTVVLPWETLRYGPLDTGASATQSFSIKHDAHFEVAVELANGAQTKASDGYVTNGQYGETVRINIEAGGVMRLRQQ